MKILKIENLCVETSAKSQIIKNFSLELECSHILGILSPTGSGKTTLLNCVAGIPPKNVNVTGNIELAQNIVISYAFQDYRLLNNCTVLENLLIPLKHLKNISILQKQEEARELLQKMQLDSPDKKAGVLSGGEKQRLSLARALIYPSNLLLLDEPFNALSQEVKESVLDVVKEQLKSRSAIIVSHDKNDLDYLCESIVKSF